MSVAYAGITDDIEQRLMLSKLVDLVTKSVGDVTWSRLIGEHLGQLVHRAKHVAHLLLNRLGVLLLERT